VNTHPVAFRISRTAAAVTLALACLGAASPEIPGVVVRVSGGDSLVFDTGRERLRVTLARVTAPAGDTTVGEELGRLVAALHHALATPSQIIDFPVVSARPQDVRRWKATANDTLDEAVVLAHDDELATWAPAMRSVLDGVEERTARVQPVHGDLHVGQVLEWAGGLAVIDFDGNQSIHLTGNGRYMMSPVISILSVN